MAPSAIELDWPIRLVQRFEFRRKLGICERLFGRSLSQ